mmetsp:Transcript_132318/g.423334  ORF Transcript_132318/g.423334 Transcript_132318/m.423334 type:complete len:262 (-) Transcript_132318:417-1202(-)
MRWCAGPCCGQGARIVAATIRGWRLATPSPASSLAATPARPFAPQRGRAASPIWSASCRRWSSSGGGMPCRPSVGSWAMPGCSMSRSHRRPCSAACSARRRAFSSRNARRSMATWRRFGCSVLRRPLPPPALLWAAKAEVPAQLLAASSHYRAPPAAVPLRARSCRSNCPERACPLSSVSGSSAAIRRGTWPSECARRWSCLRRRTCASTRRRRGRPSRGACPCSRLTATSWDMLRDGCALEPRTQRATPTCGTLQRQRRG